MQRVIWGGCKGGTNILPRLTSTSSSRQTVTDMGGKARAISPSYVMIDFTRDVRPEGVAEISWRATTSGGPGGQHANRTLSRVEVQFDVEGSATLGPRQRARLLERLGPVVRASASDSRSQARNRQLALERLAAKLDAGLRDQAPAAPPGRRRARRCAGWSRSAAARQTKRTRTGAATRRRLRPGSAQPLKANSDSAAPRPWSSWASSSGSSSARGPRSAVRAA